MEENKNNKKPFLYPPQSDLKHTDFTWLGETTTENFFCTMALHLYVFEKCLYYNLIKFM